MSVFVCLCMSASISGTTRTIVTKISYVYYLWLWLDWLGPPLATWQCELRTSGFMDNVIIIIIIIIIIKGIYIAQVRKGHKCAMSAEMAVWLRNCLYLYSYLSHN